MNTKLYFGFFIVIFVFLGRHLEQSTVPNQQMLIEFSDDKMTSENLENTIQIVENRLRSIGVTHIQIGQFESGQLKITYFSRSDINQIQNIFSEKEGFKSAYTTNQDKTDLPKEEGSKDYRLNISEIKHSPTNNWDFEGTIVIEQTPKSDRLLNPEPKSFAGVLNTKPQNELIKNAFLVYTTIENAIDTYSYQIPEVRAGPSLKETVTV